MRIVGGSAGGCRLTAPRGRATRPTADRVKESLFAILGPTLHATRVLDLYAGAGCLGIEALSRGAAEATFVERDRSAADHLRNNLSRARLAGRSRVRVEPVESALRRLSREALPFDLVLADPPYDKPPPDVVLGRLAATELLAEGGLLVIEHDQRSALSEPLPSGWCLEDRRSYGTTALSFVRRCASPEPEREE